MTRMNAKLTKNCLNSSNGTLVSCCHRRFDTFSVCRKDCSGEPCSISWDCGTSQGMFCCSDHICRSSSNLCPAPKTPTWITAIVAVAVVCAVLGIAATAMCIFFNYKRRYRQEALLGATS